MRIAVPTTSDRGLEATVSGHFGRAPAFTIVDDETGHVDVQPNLNRYVGGFCGQALEGRGVQVVICENLGQGARRRLLGMGATVYVGARGTVLEALAAHQAGRLREATDSDVCAEHAHGHAHAHGHHGHGDGEGDCRHA